MTARRGARALLLLALACSSEPSAPKRHGPPASSSLPPPPSDAPPLERPTSRPVAAPAPASSADAAPPSRATFEVAVSDSTVSIDGVDLSMDDLAAHCYTVAAGNPNTQVVVKVVGKVDRARVRQVIQLAEEAGLSRIGTMEVVGPGRKTPKRRR